ncbi:small GTP-binding protein [Leptothrix cholodnii SP-6]|uniref:GTPase Der n=1 Tax=Leptothrix cholodnii (strain ATCC 51168 / LMG 8142 / SP-6) TaxID=395495 RepID=DER_LEPCP|nr:ribosome biogenesis GTPase Der [Leptothrix cholodnii]B1XXK9.1 RecName: Full=GTPase Der; AltName: Full=GTP-binding protein EngA [Leptothrix cholodnii SP-6]ACB35129.1 small GTP-binding protein [Leptothrix cholodnii SP-6]
MKPVIAIVGRPNVGKSTLFNRLTGRRDAIVADFAGLTRDRHYGDGKLDNHEFIVIDTGGFEPDSTSGIYKEMAKQTRQAVAEADAVVFVVDVRAGLSAQDHDIARYLRATGKRVLLAANKAEGMKDGPQLAEFYELGMGEPLAVSSAHGQGVRSLIEMALEGIEPPEPEEGYSEEELRNRPTRLAVAGRPNVGKSTLINTWLGEERLVAFDLPGTTRDAIHVPFERGDKKYELIDTAGLRRKGKVFESIEKFSVVKTLQAISDANVVLLLIDATEGVSDQDAHIAGYVLDAGRAVVIAINKWDAIDSYQRETLQRSIEQRLAFLKFAPVLMISAKKRQGLGPLWKAIDDAWASATRKLPTPQLTRLLLEAVEYQQPKRAGAVRPKLRYAHQGGQNPPIIVIHGNAVEHVTEVYKRYLEARFREHFKLVGTPMRIELRASHNPFVSKDS